MLRTRISGSGSKSGKHLVAICSARRQKGSPFGRAGCGDRVADQAGRAIEAEPPQIRFAAGIVKRAQMMVDAAPKTSRLQLSIFALGAGLMAGTAIKRQTPKRI